MQFDESETKERIMHAIPKPPQDFESMPRRQSARRLLEEIIKKKEEDILSLRELYGCLSLELPEKADRALYSLLSAYMAR